MGSVALIPFLPLASAVLLLLSAGKMPRHISALLGAGSVGLAAVFVALLARAFLTDGQIVEVSLWTWMAPLFLRITRSHLQQKKPCLSCIPVMSPLRLRQVDVIGQRDL